jgi:hypothetical protein
MDRGPSTFVVTVLALFVAVLTLWVSLRHEQEHRSDLMTEVATISLGAVSFVLVTWAAIRNVKDANRAKSLSAQLQTVKDDSRLRIESLERKIETLTREHQSEVTRLRAEQQEQQLEANSIPLVKVGESPGTGTFKLGPESAVSNEVKTESVQIIHAGIAHVGISGNTWVSNGGSIPAAVAIVKNFTQRQLRNVYAFAKFYDADGRRLSECNLPWLDEALDNTGLSVDQDRALIFAVQRPGSAAYFYSANVLGRPERLLQCDDIRITVQIFWVDDKQCLITHNFALHRSPFISFSLES